jgi:hypothetical protein
MDFRDRRHLFVQDLGIRTVNGLTKLSLHSTVRRMTNDRLSGWALILGSIGMIITMSLHPSGKIAIGQVEPMIRRLIAVHGLALACVPVLFLGARGLAGRVASRDRLTAAGIVTYAFALMAVTNAAVADGLVTPSVLRQIVASAGSQSAIDGWQMMARYNFYVNQAYAEVFVAASSVAILLWSAAIWRSRQLARALGIYGCVLGAVTLLALFSGHLNLDAHGFGIIIFGQAAWFIAAGALLLRREDQLVAAKV